MQKFSLFSIPPLSAGAPLFVCSGDGTGVMVIALREEYFAIECTQK